MGGIMSINYEYLYDKKYYKDFLSVTHYNSGHENLGVKKYKNALIKPAQNLWGDSKGGVVEEPDKKEILEAVKSDKKVIYIGSMIKIWGHAITDNLSKMWVLLTDKYLQEYKSEGFEILYDAYEGFTFYPNYKQFLELAGIDIEGWIQLDRPTVYKEILIPEDSFYVDEGGDWHYHFTKEYMTILDAVKKAEIEEKLSFDKIYFSYRNAGKGKVVGEEELEEFFSSVGYKIIQPEKYTFFEQLSMLRNCKSFAATIGSCAHNSVFCKPGTQVVLIPRAHYLTGYQQCMDEITDLDINYIDSSLSVCLDKKCATTGPFFYYPSKKLLDFYEVESESKWRSKEYKEKVTKKKFNKYKFWSAIINDSAEWCEIEFYNKVLEQEGLVLKKKRKPSPDLLRRTKTYFGRKLAKVFM